MRETNTETAFDTVSVFFCLLGVSAALLGDLADVVAQRGFVVILGNAREHFFDIFRVSLCMVGHCYLLKDFTTKSDKNLSGFSIALRVKVHVFLFVLRDTMASPCL